MPLDTQHWRFVGTVATAATSQGWLDGIWTLGNSATYADGTARTGASTAWTWGRQQIGGVTEGVFGSMPYTNSLNIRYVIGGSNTGRSYTVLSPDTSALQSNVLVCAMNRGVASTSGLWYDAAGPYGSGFSGYWRFGRALVAIAYDRISMYECEEQCMIVQSVASSGVTSIGGLFSLDPRDAGGTAAETDGRRWGMFCTGAGATTSGTGNFEYFPASASGMFSHGSSAHVGHCGIFAVGSTTVTQVARMLTPGGASAMNTGISTPNGKLPYSEDIPFNQANSTVHGVWRGLAYTRKAVCNTAWINNGATLGYFVGASTSAAADGVLLLRN